MIKSFNFAVVVISTGVMCMLMNENDAFLGDQEVKQDDEQTAQESYRQDTDIAADPTLYTDFEAAIKDDLAKGLAGDEDALADVIQACEDELRKHPGNSFAKCIKGVSHVFLSGAKFQSNDFQAGMKLWTEGLKQLNESVAADEDSPLIRLYRGETLLEVWVHDPQTGTVLAKDAAHDIDFVYTKASGLWNSLSTDRQTKILGKLPAAFSKIGDEENAQNYAALTADGSEKTPLESPAPETESSDDEPSGHERIDLIVRDDLFAGMNGDRERHKKAMKYCEDLLKENPNHAGAMAFHGWGKLIEAGWAKEEGAKDLARQLENTAMEEMNLAASLAPDDVGPLLVRGSVLMGLTTNPDLSKTERDLFLAISTYDFEKVYQLQTDQGYFQFLSGHAKGELLFGLADAWHRRGNLNKAREYYSMVVEQVPSTDYSNDAEMMLSGKLDASKKLKTRSCIGCH